MQIIQYLISLSILLSSCAVIAQQDSIVLSKNFQFEDGIYSNLEQLQVNSPNIPWDKVKVNIFTNPQTFITKVESIIQDTDTLDLNEIWGIVLGGIPYTRLSELDGTTGLAHFVGWQVRGKICYYAYEETLQKEIPMEAYNPLTGKAFRSGLITRETIVKREKIVHFETGEILDFTKENLLGWIEEDEALSKSVQALSPEEVEEKLFKCLLIYDDRNLVYLR